MKGARRIILPLALGLVGVGLFAGWYYRWQNITPRMRADFEWFQGLGFPDVKGKEFVRVSLRGYTLTDGITNKQLKFGFLLATNGDEFRVLSQDLEVETYSNSPPGTPELERVGFEPADLQSNATDLTKWLRATPLGVGDRFEGLNAPGTQVFALAYDCWRQGLAPTARGLYDEVTRTPRPTGDDSSLTTREKLTAMWDSIKERWKNRKSHEPTLRESLEIDLGNSAACRAFNTFEDPKVTRQQLAEKLEAVVKLYPHSYFVTNAMKTADTLRRMIEEDRTHKPVSPAELAQMPEQDRVRELIFQLRNLTPRDYRQATENTADTLAKMGYAAVPQLMDALDSNLPMRRLEPDNFASGWRPRNVPRSVETVGEEARRVLGEIAGRRFGRSTTRKSVEEWWKETAESNFTNRGLVKWQRGIYRESGGTATVSK